jgi:hypothetical protein
MTFLSSSNAGIPVDPWRPLNRQVPERTVEVDAEFTGILQMPNGLPATGGDTVVLTDDEFALLRDELFDSGLLTEVTD